MRRKRSVRSGTIFFLMVILFHMAAGNAFAGSISDAQKEKEELKNQVSPTAGASSFHKGIDVGASYGADIVAADSGVVSFSGYSAGSGNHLHFAVSKDGSNVNPWDYLR